LNTEVVCRDLANRLFEKIDTKGYETLRRQIAEIAMSLVDEGKKWDFKETLVDMAKMLFSESYLDFEARLAKENINADEALKVVKEAVYTSLANLESEWKKLAEAGKRVMENFGLEPDDFSYKKSGFGGRFDAALLSIVNPRDNTYAKKVLDGESMPYSKTTSAGLKARIDAAMPELTTAMMNLVNFYNIKVPGYHTAKAIKGNLDYLRLVLLMAKELGAWRKENNALLISDTHNLLRQLSAETTPDFIYEKTGNRLQHFLMDEFQDTSDFQYHNFKPLLQNSMGQGSYNLVVGDVKQAIYRWRNGDWKLLNSKLPNDFYAFRPAQHTLQYNYRSAKPIIKFNNYLFSALPVLLQNHINSELQNSPDAFRGGLLATYSTLLTDAFADSRQQIPDDSAEEGLVSVQFVNMQEDGESEEDQSYTVRVLKEVHGTICHLLEEGYAPGDIAILCRTNQQARETIEWLMLLQQQESTVQYPLLSADALTIASNSAVQLTIAAMQWLFDENNRLAETLLRQSFARKDGRSGNEPEVFLKAKSSGQGMPPEFFAQRERLRMLPVYDLVNEIVIFLNLYEKPEDLPFLLALLDMVQEWARFSDEGVQSFLKFWAEEGADKSLPAPAGSNAVEVVTIHKAKGLAYNIVLMPFCNWALEPSANKNIVLWADMKGTGFGQMPVMPVYYKKDLAKSELADYYFNEKVNSFMDNLNLLYVALTRARSRMMLWGPLPVNAKGKFTYDQLKRVEDLLYYSAVLKAEGEDSPVSAGFEEGDLVWCFGTEQKAILKRENKATSLPSIVFEAWRTRRKTVLKRIGDHETKEGRLARSRGILLHEILSKVSMPGKLKKVIREMEGAGKLSSSQSALIYKTLNDVLQLEPFIGWDKGTLSRLSERDIIALDGMVLRPDLVLFNQTETRVIDFKFAENRDNGHIRQVEGYKALLATMGFAGVKGYVVYGLEAEVIRC
jgi:ATP-dependent exoDNAse (exonuclease V) beta subunit